MRERGRERERACAKHRSREGPKTRECLCERVGVLKQWIREKWLREIESERLVKRERERARARERQL